MFINDKLFLLDCLNKFDMCCALYVMQPVTDSSLCNTFVHVIIKFEIMERMPLFNVSDKLTIDNDYNRSEKEIKETQRFSEMLQNQLLHIDLNKNTNLRNNLEFTAERLCHNNSYAIPDTNQEIKTIEDLPTINQVINNHYNLYLKPELVKSVWLFTVYAKIRPLLIRSDGLSVVSISSIKTCEVKCEPPNHCIPGLDLKSRPFDGCEYQPPYIPICLMDLTKYTNYLYDYDCNNIDEFEKEKDNHVWRWFRCYDYNLAREEMLTTLNNILLHDKETNIYDHNSITLFVDGNDFC